MSVVFCSTAFAQEDGGGFFSKINFGVRASGLVSTTTFNEFEDVTHIKEYGANVGVAAKFNVTDKFSVTPEVYYFYSGLNEINAPILLGYSFLNNKLDVIAGPTLMYNFEEKDAKIVTNFGHPVFGNNIVYNGVESGFELGYTAGLQYHLGKFMITGRYQGGFNGKEIMVTFPNAETGVMEKGSEKLKTSYVSLGVGFNFGGN